MSHEKKPGGLGYIGDEILPNYIGIIIGHYKDPYKPTSIMESNKGFFRGSDELLTAINEVILGYSTSSNAALQHVAPLTCVELGGSFLHAHLAFWRSVRDGPIFLHAEWAQDVPRVNKTG